MLLEVRVVSHEHRLVAVDLKSGYVCNGCKQNGRGWRYRCAACNYDMHNFCATAAPSISHPLTAENMQLRPVPVERDRLSCSACRKAVSGLRYYGYGSREALHPSCAHLQKFHTINNTHFHLSMGLSSPCSLCGKKDSGWAYISAGDTIHVHCLIAAMQTPPPEVDFHYSTNHHSPLQLCNGAPLQLIETPSTSDHRRSTSCGAVSENPKRRRNHRVVRAIFTTTTLLLKVIYALFSGDPSFLLGAVGTLISNS